MVQVISHHEKVERRKQVGEWVSESSSGWMRVRWMGETYWVSVIGSTGP